MRLPGVLARLALLVVLALAAAAPPAQAKLHTGLCQHKGERLTIPDDFALDACFDGSSLVILNQTEFPLSVSTDGSAGRPYQQPYGGVPEIPSLVFTYISPADTGLVMPRYLLRIPIGPGAASITLHGTDHNRSYVLVRFLAGWVPTRTLVEIAKSIPQLANELAAAYDTRIACVNRGNWLVDVKCEAIYLRDVGFALGRFGVNGVAKGLLRGVLQLLDTASWINNAVGDDILNYVHGTRTLRIAAAPTPASPPVEPPRPPRAEPSTPAPRTPPARPAPAPVQTPAPSAQPTAPAPLVFSVTGSCTSGGGVLSASSSGFTPDSGYTISAFYPDGSPYTNLSLGSSGTVRTDGSVAWSWDCSGDPPGVYATELIDTASGRSTGRVPFTIEAPAPAPAPEPSQPVGQTFPEQQGSRGADTFADPHSASGPGPRVDAWAWIQVSCKVYAPEIASANPDGYWYRIASPPWSDRFYAVANTFWNGDVPGQTPYLHDTDLAVPDC